MDDYIKRQDAIDAFCGDCSWGRPERPFVRPCAAPCDEYKRLLAIQAVGTMLDDSPTVGAEPVRHGRWEWDKDGMDWGIGAWKCSECKSRPNTYWATEQRNPLISASSKFCGNCGAKMDEEENENED